MYIMLYIYIYYNTYMQGVNAQEIKWFATQKCQTHLGPSCFPRRIPHHHPMYIQENIFKLLWKVMIFKSELFWSFDFPQSPSRSQKNNMTIIFNCGVCYPIVSPWYSNCCCKKPWKNLYKNPIKSSFSSAYFTSSRPHHPRHPRPAGAVPVARWQRLQASARMEQRLAISPKLRIKPYKTCG